MPVEITMPLTKLEQIVADARANEKIMKAKMEDAKAVLKAAKGAWEEAVSEVFIALDEMIADKRQPSIPFGEVDDDASTTAGKPDPNPPAPAGNPVSESPSTPTPTVTVTQVEILSPLLAVHDGAYPGLTSLPSGPPWRALNIATELDDPPLSVLSALDTFGVYTMGSLADALVGGHTFNLPANEVNELREVVELVSADDATPVKFNRDEAIPVTVKAKPEEFPPEPEQVVKSTKKTRAKRAKPTAAEPAEPESESSDETVESTTTKQTVGFDEL